MESWRRTVVGIMFEVAAGIAIPSNLLAAGALAVTGIVILAWPKLVKGWRITEPDNQKGDAPKSADSLPSRRETKEHGLSEWQHKKLRLTLHEMVYSIDRDHDHALDTISIIEDLEAGRSLQGPCGVCGKPRVKQGDPNE